MNTAKAISAQMEGLPLNFINHLVFKNRAESAAPEQKAHTARPRRRIQQVLVCWVMAKAGK